MESELSLAVDPLPGLMWIASADGPLEFVTRYWLEYTGLPMEEALGYAWVKVLHPDDLPLLLASWKHCLESGEDYKVEARVRRHDGVYRWYILRARPVRDASGKIIKWIGLNTDIEDLKRAEKALRSNQQQMEMIVDGLPEVVVLFTPQGDLHHANSKAVEYFGAPLDRLGAWSTSDLVHQDDREMFVAKATLSMTTGAPFDVESRLRRSDGAYRWFHIRGTPVRDGEGNVVLWYDLGTDIDDRKRAEALLSGEKRLLEMVARGVPLHTVLDAVCQLVDEVDSCCHSGIFLIDPVSRIFQRGGASSRISAYVDALHGFYTTAEQGPGGLAAASMSTVISEDVVSDPRWGPDWRNVVLAHGIRACLSTPILSRNQEVLGIFAIYRIETGMPTPFQRELIGRLTHIASIAIERARSDVALRRSEESFRAIVETTPECVRVIALDGTILQVNAASAGLAEVPTPDILVGTVFFDYVAPEQQQAYKDFHHDVCAGKKGIMEFDLLTVHGKRRRVETYAAPLQWRNGAVVQLGVTRDITDRNRAEGRLRRSQAMMAKAQQLSGSGSFFWRPEFGEFIWSEQVYRIFEIEPAVQMSFELVSSRVHPADRYLMEDLMGRALTGKDLSYDLRLLMSDGKVKYIYLTAHGTRDPKGRLEYIGAVQDVTERHEAEEAVGKLRAELAHVARVNSLGAVTASIAHEINQPLAGIVTNANTCLRMLSADPPNTEGALETARRTLRDGHRASDVIKRLRALFSKKAVVKDEVDLNEAALEVIELLRSEIRNNRIMLRLEAAQVLPRVAGDRVQLQQVVLNLLLNAVEAMSDVEGAVRQLVVRTDKEGDDYVQLAVSDTGPGFDPQQATKLFDAFHTTKKEGMGIGLSVSRSIVESHGGRLTATLNEGRGATFAFAIPCRVVEGRSAAEGLEAARRSADMDASRIGERS